jgi:hypothetical protein
MAKVKARLKINSDEAVERKGSVSSGLTDEAKKITNETLKQLWENLLGSTKDAREQVTGIEVQESKKTKSEGILTEGHAVSIAQEAEAKIEKIQAQVLHQEYFQEVTTGEKRKNNEQKVEIKMQIDQILAEIRTISATSQEMETIVKEANKQQVTKEVGTYHLNFFAWLLDTVRTARVRMEAGNSWMQMFAGKKNGRAYWSMAKKHGTSFSLSGERSTATQTG